MNESEIISRIEALEKQVAELQAKLAKPNPSGKAREKLQDTESNNTLVKLVHAFRNQEGWGAPLLDATKLIEWLDGNPVNGFVGIRREKQHVVWDGGSMSWRAFREAFGRVIELDETSLADRFAELMADYWGNAEIVTL